VPQWLAPEADETVAALGHQQFALLSLDRQRQNSGYSSPIVTLPIEGDISPLIREAGINQQQRPDYVYVRAAVIFVLVEYGSVHNVQAAIPKH
jgi:hypothetical protein